MASLDKTALAMRRLRYGLVSTAELRYELCIALVES